MIYLFIVLAVFFTVAIIYTEKRNNTFSKKIESSIRKIEESLLMDVVDLAQNNRPDEEIVQKKIVKVLIENMHYASEIDNVVNRFDDIEIIIDRWNSSDLLGFLDIDNDKKIDSYNKLMEYDIISFPYFSLLELINEKVIVSINELEKLDVFKNSEMSSTLIKADFQNNHNLVKYENKIYGVPFTIISSVLIYNKKIEKFFPNLNFSFENIINNIKKQKFTFAMLNNEIARSHYYEFLNIYYSFRKSNFYGWKKNKNKIVFTFDENFRKSIQIYLTLYRYAKIYNNSWNDFHQIRIMDFEMSFFWTEQLSKLLPKYVNDIGYSKIVSNNTEGKNQLDGWFLSVVRKEKNDYNEKIFDALQGLSLITKDEKIIKKVYSTTMKDNSTFLTKFNIKGYTNGNKKRYSIIKDVAEIINNSIAKPNVIENGEIMRLFSKTVLQIDPKNSKKTIDTLTTDFISLYSDLLKKLLKSKIEII